MPHSVSEAPTREARTRRKKKTDITPPSLYAVIFLNDDATPFAFVEQLLCDIFLKTETEAHAIAHSVHSNGRGVAGIYSLDEAETRASMTRAVVDKSDFPLRCEVEPATNPADNAGDANPS